jgi:hypothetical protein
MNLLRRLRLRTAYGREFGWRSYEDRDPDRRPWFRFDHPGGGVIAVIDHPRHTLEQIREVCSVWYMVLIIADTPAGADQLRPLVPADTAVVMTATEAADLDAVTAAFEVDFGWDPVTQTWTDPEPGSPTFGAILPDPR